MGLLLKTGRGREQNGEGKGKEMGKEEKGRGEEGSCHPLTTITLAGGLK